MALYLENNITKLQNKIFDANFDISKFYLSDKEIVKNILKSKNPKLKSKEAHEMVYGSTSSNSTIYPISNDNKYYEEASKIKIEVRESSMLLVKDQKSLVQDLIKTSIQIGNSIPAISLLISAPPWNVSAAISLVLLIMDAINSIINKIIDLLKYLEPIKKIKLLVDNDKYNSITSPINVSVNILLSLFDPISALKKFIDKIFSLLSSMTDPNSLKSQIKQIKKEIRRKEKDKGKAESEEEAKEIQEDIDDLKKRISDILKGFKLPTIKDGQFDENNISVSNNNELFKTLNDLKKVTSNISNSKISYLYDVELPDGTILTNLNDEDLESIKEKYKVLFKN